MSADPIAIVSTTTLVAGLMFGTTTMQFRRHCWQKSPKIFAAPLPPDHSAVLAADGWRAQLNSAAFAEVATVQTSGLYFYEGRRPVTTVHDWAAVIFARSFTPVVFTLLDGLDRPRLVASVRRADGTWLDEIFPAQPVHDRWIVAILDRHKDEWEKIAWHDEFNASADAVDWKIWFGDFVRRTVSTWPAGKKYVVSRDGQFLRTTWRFAARRSLAYYSGQFSMRPKANEQATGFEVLPKDHTS